jgi:SET domain-containing protein
MIHPHTEIRHISDLIGYGVFATRFIPKGTITYIKDPLEIDISPDMYASLPTDVQVQAEKYSFIDERGHRIMSWDFAKFVNHCCDCNTMSTGYGFEVAIRDIQAGEELTDEYGLFNLEHEFPITCTKSGCRMKLTPADISIYADKWDVQLKEALMSFRNVAQPLGHLMDTDTAQRLQRFWKDASQYVSVRNLMYVRAERMARAR